MMPVTGFLICGAVIPLPVDLVTNARHHRTAVKDNDTSDQDDFTFMRACIPF